MGGARRQWRPWAWLGIIAVLGNVLAGMLSHAPTQATHLIDDVLGPLVICTANGAKAAPDGDGSPSPGAPAGHCPACVLLAAFALAVAFVVTAIAFPVLAAAVPMPAGSSPLAVHLGLGCIRSRAPPLSA